MVAVGVEPSCTQCEVHQTQACTRVRLRRHHPYIHALSAIHWSDLDLQVAPCHRLREQWFTNHVPCNATAAIVSANEQFRRRGRSQSLADTLRNSHIIFTGQLQQLRQAALEQRYQHYQPMGGYCSLLARKFNQKGIKPLLKSAADCVNGFGFGRACIP